MLSLSLLTLVHQVRTFFGNGEAGKATTDSDTDPRPAALNGNGQPPAAKSSGRQPYYAPGDLVEVEAGVYAAAWQDAEPVRSSEVESLIQTTVPLADRELLLDILHELPEAAAD